MGYWWPPSLYAFDPVVRPLDWTKMPAKQAAPILSLPVQAFLNPDMLVTVPGEYDREMAQQLVSTATGKNLGPLGLYYAMINATADGDPPGGGLPPDTVNPDGSITINYYDFADSNRVWRKRVTYVQNKNGQQEIANRNDSEGGVPQLWNGHAWEKEGADLEREFSKAGAQIIQAIGMVASAVLAMVPGAQVAATAFGAMWGIVLKEIANGGKPPDVGDVLSMAQAMGSAVGPGLWSVVSNNVDIQRIFSKGTIAEMSKIEGEWKDKIAGVVNNIGGSLPKVDLKKLFSGFSMTTWASGELKKLPVPTAQTIGQIGNVSIAGRLDSSATAFAAAARAFAEPDPDRRLLIRRNYLWDYGKVSNSSAVSHGNPQGIGAHAEVEQDEGLMAAASFFDQYLAMLLQNAMTLGSIEAAAQMQGGSVVNLQKQRLADPQAQADLKAYISTLMTRYHMV